jgi:peroxiredoxin Q/BCP
MNLLPRMGLALLLATTALHAMASLKEGDAAPDFKAPAALAGQAFNYSLKDALQNGPVVIYFYPAAFTTGCSLQAHSFAVNADKFAAAGASIVGVSLDNIAQLSEFSADPQSCAGKIPVASDTSGAIARAFDIGVTASAPGRTDSRGREIGHGRAERTTFVVTQDGKVAATVGGVAPELNVQQALEAVQKIAARHKRP